MITYQRLAGTADVSVVIRIIDSTDGTPETGVVFNTSGIDLEYRREGAVSTDITEATLSALSDAHSDGGFLHIGNGYYRLDLPDAACAAGVTGVLVHGIVTGMVVIGCYIQLVTYNPFDGVRLGLTALPNAAADAAGGLVISDAGGLDADAQRSDVAAILVDTGTTLDTKLDTIDNFLDTEIAAILAAVDTEVAAILSDTNAILVDTGTTLDGRIPAALVGGRMDASVGAVAAAAIGTGDIAAAALNEIADAVLDRILSTGTDSGADNTTARTVRQCLRVLRNKTSIAVGTLTVTKEDDVTASWTSAITTAAGDPISASDPT